MLGSSFFGAPGGVECLGKEKEVLPIMGDLPSIDCGAAQKKTSRSSDAEVSFHVSKGTLAPGFRSWTSPSQFGSLQKTEELKLRCLDACSAAQDMWSIYMSELIEMGDSSKPLFFTIASLGQLLDFELCGMQSLLMTVQHWVRIPLMGSLFYSKLSSPNSNTLRTGCALRVSGIRLHDQLPAVAELAHPWDVKAKKQENAIEGAYLAKLKAKLEHVLWTSGSTMRISKCAFSKRTFV